MTDPTLPPGRAVVQVVAVLIALSVVLLAIFGFIPGVTTRYGDLAFAGDASKAQLLGVFQISVLHNLMHGIVGLILGSLRLPTLIRYGEPLAFAVGTNMAVGFFVGAAGVVGHLPGGVDWELLGVGAAASIPGALAGARLTGHLPERRLRHAIAAVLFVAGGVAIAEAVT